MALKTHNAAEAEIDLAPPTSSGLAAATASTAPYTADMHTHRRNSTFAAAAGSSSAPGGGRYRYDSADFEEIDDEFIFDIDDSDPFSVNPTRMPPPAAADTTATTNTIMLKKVIVNVVFILMWYTFSLVLSLYNKWMFSGDHLNFKFPLFASSLHMVIQTALAAAALTVFPFLRPPRDRRMSWRVYLLHIGPCGIATGGDIGLGNMSLRYITLGFYTMVKSSNLVFVLMFAFVFRLERPTLKLVGIIALMTSGVLMMVASETSFVFVGFILVLMAAILSGFRWALTQILLKNNESTSNPFATIFYLAPVMGVTLFLLANVLEGPRALLTSDVWATRSPLVWVVILAFPGVLAFAMTAAEFALLKRTNVVTLSIVGIFKEVLTILAAASVFGDALTPVNITGLVLTLIAIALYNYMRMSSMRSKIKDELGDRGGYTSLPVPATKSPRTSDVLYNAESLEMQPLSRPHDFALADGVLPSIAEKDPAHAV
ncbi:triose-phosphate transporter family-domain-containing protein [Dipodascopsis tothii]|uniref:triose-phosphate transporter family-domain-containing protein n=1 Tax=Dipodascopsis tothii TaxID=44089 RepID=UPI0034CD549B